MPPVNSLPQTNTSFGHKIFHFFLWFFAVIGVVSTLIAGYVLFRVLPLIGNGTPTTNQIQNTTNNNNSSTSLDQTINLTLVDAALKAYHDTNNGIYPQTLAELAPKYLSSVPTDIGGKPYQYQTTENARGYQLCHLTDNGQSRCFGKDSTGN